LTNPFPILIAEDNPVSRELLERHLIKAGYGVVSVENGRQAMEQFDEMFFPIVLSDWMMPEMDGLELCRSLRKHDYPGYVYIILLTGKDSQEDIIAGLEAGADDYLTKPFNKPELIARLNTGKRILELERSLKEANEEIRILSITDPLTGCYNRGYMSERLVQEIKRSKKIRHLLSVVLCDIDHFKSINDTYGHQAGDQVLKDFVQCITGMSRNGVDWLARYGGEEFLLVLPETDIKNAGLLAERIRKEISKKATKIQKGEIRITASFGVAGFDPAEDDKLISPESLIRLADKSLYQAKQEGRNRVRGGST
jgi:diguanylate cyclase (GGDEF)-like protein